jgi:hypothetical protein
MIGTQSLIRAGIVCPRLPRGSGFLLGAVLATFFVLGIAGASLMLSGATGARSGEIGHYRLPPAQLSLGTPPGHLV